jgi:glucose-6-phosphate 1-dehydrogenase
MSAPTTTPPTASAPAKPMENPLRAGLVEERLPEPCTVVIFGASGDLTKRKLMPALYSLSRDRLLPPNIAVVGFARRPSTDDAFRSGMREGCDKYARRRPVDPNLWTSFAQGIFYVQGEFHDSDAYRRLREKLDEIDRAHGIPGNRVFYLSTPPTAFPIILEQLGHAGLVNRAVTTVANESQIYRIDHYLGKETVQNLLVFRFANGIFEPLWNAKYVDHVQITGAESLGIEGRGGYFEQAGILRDMVQNHLFQIVNLTAMEPPVAWSADEIRDEKLKVLKALRPIPQGKFEYVVRGQYTAGSIGGKALRGYKEEPGVAANSITETFVALRFFIDNWRWAGVPFYLRSAKAMPKKITEVALHFKAAPLSLFAGQKVEQNVLSIRIQPDEGISLKFGSKVPGPSVEIHPVAMEFRYGTSFGVEPPEAYERLILDCMLGDATLFTRGDEVEASWKWVSRIHQAWAAAGAKMIPTYEAGTWGPKAADALLERDGRSWRRP